MLARIIRPPVRIPLAENPDAAKGYRFACKLTPSRPLIFVFRKEKSNQRHSCAAALSRNLRCPDRAGAGAELLSAPACSRHLSFNQGNGGDAK